MQRRPPRVKGSSGVARRNLPLVETRSVRRQLLFRGRHRHRPEGRTRARAGGFGCGCGPSISEQAQGSDRAAKRALRGSIALRNAPDRDGGGGRARAREARQDHVTKSTRRVACRARTGKGGPWGEPMHRDESTTTADAEDARDGIQWQKYRPLDRRVRRLRTARLPRGPGGRLVTRQSGSRDRRPPAVRHHGHRTLRRSSRSRWARARGIDKGVRWNLARGRRDLGTRFRSLNRARGPGANK